MTNVGRYKRVPYWECHYCDYMTCRIKGIKRTKGKQKRTKCSHYGKGVKND